MVNDDDDDDDDDIGITRLQIGPEDRKLRWGDKEKGLAPEIFFQIVPL